MAAQLRQISNGILRHVVLANLKMQMWTGHSPGAADLSDDVALLHSLSSTDQVDLIVSVNRNDAAVMADNHNVAIATDLIAVNDFAFLYGTNRRALEGGDIDTIVKSGTARAKTGIDRARDQPDQRFVRRSKRIGAVATDLIAVNDFAFLYGTNRRALEG